MDELDSLMAMAAEGGDVGAEGIDRLAARGAPVVPAVIDAIAQGGPISVGLAILTLLDGDDRVAALVAHLEHPDHRVTDTVVRALGRCGDPAALAPLAAELGRTRHQLTATAALGELGAAAAIPVLRASVAALLGAPPFDQLAAVRARARDDGDPFEPLLIATCAAALARLGEGALAGPAIALARLEPDDDGYDSIGVRLAAVGALDALIAPGVAEALHHACDDPDREVAAAALTATARLGRRADIERWLALAARRPERADEVARGLELVTGEVPDPDQLADWWAAASPRFGPGVCFWRGAPASPGAMVAALRDVEVGQVRQDLRARTGLPFILDMLGGDPATPRELARLDAWWAANRDRYAPGALHRWGHVGAVDAVD